MNQPQAKVKYLKAFHRHKPLANLAAESLVKRRHRRKYQNFCLFAYAPVFSADIGIFYIFVK